jgi:hypothetical protein
MSTDIHQLGRKNSESAVVCGKGLVQLGHFPTDAGQPLDKMNLETHFGQVQRGLHACNASANDKDIPIHKYDLLPVPGSVVSMLQKPPGTFISRQMRFEQTEHTPGPVLGTFKKLYLYWLPGTHAVFK